MYTFNKFLLFLLLFSSIYCFEPTIPDYQPLLSTIKDANTTCVDSGFYNCSQCPCDLARPYYNYTTLGVSFFTIAWSFIFIMGFILLKELRQKPGDIILVIAISTFFLGIKSAAEAIHLLRSDSNAAQESDINLFWREEIKIELDIRNLQVFTLGKDQNEGLVVLLSKLLILIFFLYLNVL